MQLNLHNQTFLLSEHKALFWLEQKMLIIADAHFSKETHFRKNGVAIPAGILQNDLRRMETMIDTFDPDQILFLGDMFHSEENDGLNEFLNWRKTFSSLKITLVIGNHDILINEWYTHAKIFCIGGPDGLAPEIDASARLRWSLSALTLPHGLARVVVAEALYRAVSLIKGLPYHRA